MSCREPIVQLKRSKQAHESCSGRYHQTGGRHPIGIRGLIARPTKERPTRRGDVLGIDRASGQCESDQSGINAQPRICNVAIVVSADTSTSTTLSTSAGAIPFPTRAWLHTRTDTPARFNAAIRARLGFVAAPVFVAYAPFSAIIGVAGPWPITPGQFGFRCTCSRASRR